MDRYSPWVNAGPCFNIRATWALHWPNVAKVSDSFCMVDDIQIARLSAKMRVLSISDDLQMSFSQTRRTMGVKRTRGRLR